MTRNKFVVVDNHVVNVKKIKFTRPAGANSTAVYFDDKTSIIVYKSAQQICGLLNAR